MKSARTLSILSFFALLSVAYAGSAPLHRWTIRETLPGGMVELRVIQELPATTQNVLPQKVIFNQIMTREQAERFELSPEWDLAPEAAQPGRPLWEISKPQWTQADEDDYSHWFATQVTTDFLQGTGLAADCADAGLLFRWVYARDHKLPIADSLEGSGKLFGHFSGNADWDSLPESADWRKDERFKAALRYLFANTFTHTIVADQYPTIISPQWVKPGSMFMIIRKDSGHTQTIHDVDLTNGITTFWGNEPASSSVFSSPIMLDTDSKEMFGRWRYVEQESGINGPVWELTAPDKMPGYSADQFGQNFTDPDALGDWVNQQLGIHIPDPVRLASLTKLFYGNLQFRQYIVAQGTLFCSYDPCDPASEDYSDYSTFARDARLFNERKEILALIAKLGPTNPAVIKALAEIPDDEVIPSTGLKFIALLEDPTALSRLNPDPRVSVAERWGLSGAQITPTVTLNSDSMALETLLIARTYIVKEGAAICKTIGDPNSESLKFYDTAKADDLLRKFLPKVVTESQVSGVDADSLSKIQASYAKFSLQVTSSICPEKDGACSVEDAAFAGGAQARMANWSSNPCDPPAKRWGL